MSLSYLEATRCEIVRRLCLVLFSLALGSVANDARAEVTKAQLVWSAPDAGVCAQTVTVEALEREVEQLVGHTVFVPQRTAADVVLRGGIAAAEVGVRAWFEAHDLAGRLVGRRELNDESGDCGALQHSAALVLSVLLDRPSGVAEEQSFSARRHVARQVSVSAGGAVTYGPLPQLAPGLWSSLELRLLRWLQLRADGSYWQPISAATRAGLGATMSAFTAGLSLCPGRSPGAGSRLGFGVCLGGQLGAIAASPVGLRGPDRVRRLLAQATLEVGFSVRIQRWTSLFVAAGPSVALSRPRFYYTREDTQVDVTRPRAFAATARIGLTIGAP